MSEHQTNNKLIQEEESAQKKEVTPLELDKGEEPKAEEEKEEGQVAWKAYLGATGAAIGLGLADYLASLLASLGLTGIWAEWFGCVMAWISYHLYCYISWRCYRDPEDQDYMTKEKSMYYEVVPDDEASADLNKVADAEAGASNKPKEYRFSKIKTCGMITRVIFQLGIQLSLLTTFYFGGRSGVNNGIISTIFSSGVIFTAIIFYFVYGQKLSWCDISGAVFIVGCVALISIGGAGGSHGGGHGPDLSKGLSDEEKNFNLMLAIISATVTGLVFALNSLSIQFCTANGCGVSQANMDAMLVMFIILLPGFLAVELGRGDKPSPYGWTEMIIATAILVTQVFGIISLSVGLKYGTAGPVQAIENQKTTIQTLLEAAVQRNLPLPIQWGGLVCGIFGVTIIVCQPKKEAPKVEEDNKVEPAAGTEAGTSDKKASPME